MQDGSGGKRVSGELGDLGQHGASSRPPSRAQPPLAPWWSSAVLHGMERHMAPCTSGTLPGADAVLHYLRSSPLFSSLLPSIPSSPCPSNLPPSLHHLSPRPQMTPLPPGIPPLHQRSNSKADTTNITSLFQR